MSAWILRNLNAVCIGCGLSGIGYGLWQVYAPSAFAVVGAVLLWAGLPE